MTVTGVDAPATLLDRPHHDGSDAYVLERPDEQGGPVGVAVNAVTAVRVSENELPTPGEA